MSAGEGHREGGPGRFSALAEDECRDLLRTHTIGRIGFAASEGPTILPVSYALQANRIVFRTAAGGVLAELEHGRPVAFEVDDFDTQTQTGWSVLVRGTTDVPAELRELSGPLPIPWASGVRDQVICLSLDSVSGRIVARED